jgi:hypothetical protein
MHNRLEIMLLMSSSVEREMTSHKLLVTSIFLYCVFSLSVNHTPKQNVCREV